MCYKTVTSVDDGFGGRTPSCREYTHPRADSNARIYAAIPERKTIGAVLQVHIKNILDTYEIKIQKSTTTNAKESEPCATELEHSRIEETHARQSKIPTVPVCYVQEIILVGERK